MGDKALYNSTIQHCFANSLALPKSDEFVLILCRIFSLSIWYVRSRLCDAVWKMYKQRDLSQCHWTM